VDDIKNMMNETKVNELLAKQESMGVRQLVQSLPEETPSLAWRSQLNLRLMEVAERKQRLKARKLRLMWSGSLATGIAAVTVVAVVLQPVGAVQPQRQHGANLAAQMVATHQESNVITSVSAADVNGRETSIEFVGFEPEDEML
jgi:hypothetical protein